MKSSHASSALQSACRPPESVCSALNVLGVTYFLRFLGGGVNPEIKRAPKGPSESLVN
jgi:hypothetical protein